MSRSALCGAVLAFIWPFLMSTAGNAQTARGVGEIAPAPVAPIACVTDYPESAIKNAKMGTVTILFRVLADGRVDHVTVAHSSGSDELDSATVNCAKSWRYRPAVRDGHAVDSMAGGSVGWLLAIAGETTGRYVKNALVPISLSNDCLTRASITAERLQGKSGVTVVRFGITAGALSNVVLKESSGDEDLDNKALACVAGWRFAPKLALPDVRVTGWISGAPAGCLSTYPGQTAPDPSEPDKPATGTSTAKIDWREALLAAAVTEPGANIRPQTGKALAIAIDDEGNRWALTSALHDSLWPASRLSDRIERDAQSCSYGTFSAGGAVYELRGYETMGALRWAISRTHSETVAFLVKVLTPEAEERRWRKMVSESRIRFTDADMMIMLGVAEGPWRKIYRIYDGMPNDVVIKQDMCKALTGLLPVLIVYGPQGGIIRFPKTAATQDDATCSD